MELADKKLCVNTYDELKMIVTQVKEDKRIFVLFYGSKDSRENSWYTLHSCIFGILFDILQVSR